MSETWSLVQYIVDDDPRIRVGISCAGTVRQAPSWLPAESLMDLLEVWNDHVDALRALDPGALSIVHGAILQAPLTYPRTIICAGANYYDHAAEMKTRTPDPDADPFFFLKTPATTIVGPGTDVAISSDDRSHVDWEAELGVVIGSTCTRIEAPEAASHVAGYVVANDLSDRGLFHRENSVFPAFEWDWVSHKNQDGFCPLGAGLVPAWQVPDPGSLAIRLDVNGVVKQDSNTSQMVVDAFAVVAAASRIMTLHPGDVVLTGTPAGVGMPRNDYLKDGDVVTARIEGVGSVTNRIVVR